MPRSDRRSRVLVFLVAAACGFSTKTFPGEADDGAGPRSDQPNILLILADDLGYGDLGCFGAPDMRTPNLDRLSETGMRFLNAYANCPVCSPTRASLLTGRTPDRVGVPGVIRTHPENNWGYLDPRVPILPVPLKTAGYRTALVGKWHLGLESPNTPNERGFDSFQGFLGDMMDDYFDHRRHDRNYMRRDDEIIEPRGHASDLFTQWAIDELRAGRERNTPFFVYLAYNAPHTPIQPPDEWLARVREREGPSMTNDRARLVALIEHLDDGVGRVIEALRAAGRLDDTLILFTSDNGGQLSVGARVGPYRGGKGDLYEGGLRVPLIASWPGRVRAGTRSDRLVMTMDLFATICDVAGVDPPPGTEGVSILPTLLGKPQPPDDRVLFWVRREGGGRYLGGDYHAARRGPWKLVRNHPFEPYQLYNLDEDPQEKINRADDDREIFRQLVEALQSHIRHAGAIPWQAPTEGFRAPTL